MDKHFVNIDDLVRQRLGGGEEQEQAGSWGRMHDLLDKEMPQKRPVAMYWRRTFSAMALLLLIGGISFGGYELAKDKAASTSNTAELASAVKSANGISGNSTASSMSTDNNTTTNEPTANGSAENRSIETTTPTADQSAKAISGSVARTHVSGNKVNEANKTNNAAPNHTNRNNTPVNDATNAPIAANSKTNTGIANAKHTAGKTNDNDELAANNVKTNNTSAKDDAGVKNNNSIADNNNNDDDNTAVASAKKGKSAIGKVKASNTPGNNAIADKAAAAESDATENKVAANNTTATSKGGQHSTGRRTGKNNAGNTSMKDMALASAVPGRNNVTNVTSVTSVTHVTKKGKKVSGNKIAFANNTNGSDIEIDSDENGAIATEKTPAKKSTARAIAANTATGSKSKKTVGKTAAVPNAVAGNTNNTTGIEKAGKPGTRKAQRQVQRLILSQRYVKTSPTKGVYRMDTISNETIMEDYDQAIAALYGPETYNAFMANNEETNIATVAKENKVKKASGSSSMENLHAAFNDVKDKVRGAHFGAGLTAGVNGTFFGPNSFKGFQFGLTGSFVFSPALAVMGELKYFHRINSNYTLNDDYYQYTPAATGGYKRELIRNPYSIAALHSIELPISVRYCIGNFNFFFGGNVEYSFAVNTGAYPLVDATTATNVATIGNDNVKKLNNDDFGSKFGLGYLVGASYQVSPNVMIDFRNVQNIWDNSKTVGEKHISSQLYRSPSLQLSVGYRLGGNKKDKE